MRILIKTRHPGESRSLRLGKAVRWIPAFVGMSLLLFSFSVFADPATEDMYRRYPGSMNPSTIQNARPLVPDYQIAPMYGARGFSYWLQGFKQKALAQGLNGQFLDRALYGVEYLPRVIELDRKQPEHKITFAEYKKNIVSEKRVQDGRERLAQYRPILNRATQIFGVPPQYIVALWGIETNYGRITGGFDILSSLATLAYEGRRAAFFEKEFINALRILAGGHAGTNELTGSWAGAMGQCQFMPSSYLKYALDGDGDGTVNIWSSMPDVFASMANYLRTEGWDKNLRWGRAVIVPGNIPQNLYGREIKRPLSYWKKIGVRQADGRPLENPSDATDPLASLVAPDGPGTASYLVYKNYDVIMHWNRSTYFATSVGLLADAIASGPAD